ncbi:MAG: hypothetical protein ACTHM6_19005 [Tepidisphaeraceae bacterium]
MRAVSRRSAYLLIAAFVAVFLGRLLFCDFTWWDDPDTVTQNPMMNPVRIDSFIYHWTHSTAAIYIPLTYTVWAAVASIARVPPGEFGITLNPYFFHAANLIVHIAGAWFAWEVLRKLLRNNFAALIGAIVWAIHPVQVESVGWVSGLKDVLSGTLVLATLWRYLAWRESGKARDYLVALGLFVLAMLAKPSAMTAPLLIIAIDRLAQGVSWRRCLAGVLPFLIATAPIALIARTVQPTPTVHYPTWLVPLLAGHSLAFYLVKIAAPLRLSFDYGQTPAAVLASGNFWYAWLLPAALVCGALIYFVRDADRQPDRALPLLAFLLFALAPLHVLGLTKFDFQKVSTVADHYLYVAMLGPALLGGWAVMRFPKFTAPALLVLLVLGCRSMVQAGVWQNEQTLMNHALSVNPRSWVAHNNLASLAGKAGDFDRERAELLQAETLLPGDPLIESGLLSSDLRFHYFDAASEHASRLLAAYDAADIPAPEKAAGYVTVVSTYAQFHYLDEAEHYLQAGLKQDPDNEALQVLKARLAWMRDDPAFKKRQTSSRPAAATRP